MAFGSVPPKGKPTALLLGDRAAAQRSQSFDAVDVDSEAECVDLVAIHFGRREGFDVAQASEDAAVDQRDLEAELGQGLHVAHERRDPCVLRIEDAFPGPLAVIDHDRNGEFVYAGRVETGSIIEVNLRARFLKFLKLRHCDIHTAARYWRDSKTDNGPSTLITNGIGHDG